MNFDKANIRSVKADIGKGEITIGFSVDLNQENLAEAEGLRDYLATKDEAATEMTIDIYPHQMRLFPPDTKITIATPKLGNTDWSVEEGKMNDQAAQNEAESEEEPANPVVEEIHAELEEASIEATASEIPF